MTETKDRCYWCHRDDDGSGVLVTIDGIVRGVCGPCWDKVSPDIPLDYSEDEFENREGQPEFNGAFR
jgi:hypothetical protein